MNDLSGAKKLVLVAIVLSVLLVSCGAERPDIDVSDIDVKLRIKRFEKDLFALNPDSIEQNISFFTAKYGLFYELFNKNIINIGGVELPSYKNNLRGFITDADMRSVYADCIAQYAGIENLAETLSDAFKHYKYYFP